MELLFSHHPAENDYRALMLSEKSLTVNSFACLGFVYQRTLNSFVQVTVQHRAARKTVNRALMLAEKSLTVNSFACLGFADQQTLNSNAVGVGGMAGNDYDYSSFKPCYKIWLEKDGGVLGSGFFQLLEQIEKKGTIAAAAESMAMSYRAAWGKIKAAEKQCGISIVTTKVGGDTGGGTTLTPEALAMLRRFYRFRQDIDNEIAKIFKSHFFD